MMIKLTKLSSITKLLASFAIAMNIAYSPVFNHFIPDAIAAENTPVSAETKQLIERLTGQWQLNTIIRNSDSLNLIFTNDGKLYLVNPNQKSAFTLEYQINTSNGQTYLDILQGSFAARITVDFSHKGQLILQQLFVPAGFQSSENILGGLFLPNALFLNRISNDTSLPKDIELISLHSGSIPARQSEAKTYVGSMNRAQQAFVLEKNYFAGNLAILEIGIPPETENYKYQVMVLDSTKAVQNIAIAKSDGLKSYTGLVRVIKSPDASDLSIAILCESITATRQTPPKFILKPEPECPSGYKQL
jgi:hypothetical protein